MLKTEDEARGFQHFGFSMYLTEGSVKSLGQSLRLSTFKVHKGSVLSLDSNIKELHGNVCAGYTTCNVQHPFSIISVVGPFGVQAFRGLAGTPF